MSVQYERIKECVGARIARREFPGCVIGVVDRAGLLAVYPFGLLTYEREAPAVTASSVYDLASVTKCIPGSALMMHLIDSGKVRLDDPLARYVPEFANAEGKERVLIRHLLTYTLDLEVPAMSSLRDRKAKEIIAAIVSAPLKRPPGEAYLYTNSTSFFFHMIIERVTGKRADHLAEELFFRPLGMDRTGFFPLTHIPKREIAPTEILDWRGGEVRGEVHDESTAVLQKEGVVPLFAGLFSTAPDLTIFLEMLLNEGEFGGHTIFSPDIVRDIYRSPLPEGRALPAFGWERGEPWMGSERSHIFGKRGFTGTSVMVHPEKGKALVILTNATYPMRPRDADQRHYFRREIADIVFGV